MNNEYVTNVDVPFLEILERKHSKKKFFIGRSLFCNYSVWSNFIWELLFKNLKFKIYGQCLVIEQTNILSECSCLQDIFKQNGPLATFVISHISINAVI